MSELKPSKRFGREDWLDLGLKQLTKHGAAGLTVEALCQAAGRTRGSLYHHFSDHGAFTAAMMAHWRKRYTLDIAQLSSAEPTAGQRQKLADLALAIDPVMEGAVRKFAQTYAPAAQIVAAVDEERVAFVTGLYRQAGMEADMAHQIAQIEYAAYVGAQMLWPDMPAEMRQELDQRFAWLLKRAELLRP